MGDIEGRKDTPAPVDLGIVLVEFGDDQEDSSQGYRDGESGYQRVCLRVQLYKSLTALQDVDHLGRKLIQLWDVWLDRLGPAGTVFEPEERRDSHDKYALMLLIERLEQNLPKGRI